ncbi:macrolide transporter [Bacillus sp. FJAT-27264]|uniref:MFS transporter n=1 Tax=Paenibacillus sp. (strain DSM 101736 / FJAT-27264) TaxID=1850362 RepID=UPI000807DCF0|nr:MFS transporter [Bacillus sp. FJAT-27264]OBZ14241.1 macrolide transporter [Bacillus sp. FJAT-27264]
MTNSSTASTLQSGTDEQTKPLKLPLSYIRFLMGMFISRLGDSLFTFAIPWISYKLTQSSIVMGSMYAVSVLPIVLFGPIVGSMVDRWERKRLMIITDSARALIVALIPLLHFLGVLQLWHLYAITFVLTILSLMFDVSIVAIIPSLAPKQLTRANASYQLTNQIAEMLGPLLAGVIIIAIGGFNTLWLDALSFTGTLFVLLLIPSFGKPKPSSNLLQIFKDIGEGFKWLIRSKINLSFSFQAMIGNFGFSAAFGVLMFYLMNTLHLNTQESSINYTLLGFGGIVGSILAVPLEKRFRRGVLIPMLLGVGTIGFLYASVSHFWLAPGIAFFAVTVCNVAWNTIVTSVRQEIIPSDMIGRVLGFSRVLTRLAMPLGALTGAALSEWTDPRVVFAVAAGAKMLEIVIALVTPIRKL